MGKISPVIAKYIVHANISVEGSVDRPDIIGAIFGQTEGLLGSELELRELQRSGKIGRIEVKTDIKEGKSNGTIIIPSSLDLAETFIIAAALETVQRIGPCDSRVRIEKVEDVRISKRDYVINRAKELLSSFTKDVLPDSQELTEEVAQSVRAMEVTEYGKERLPAGPSIDESDQIIIVEGRADVINLLKQGFKNVIALNGTSVPETIKDICRKKEVIAFLDGDRGGDLILKELKSIADIDFVARAPAGKEVEELTKKEIHQALRAKVSLEQVRLENGKENINSRNYRGYKREIQHKEHYKEPPKPRYYKKFELAKKDKTLLKDMLTDLIGTRGAYILDKALSILGKVPAAELPATLPELKDTYAVILDGQITNELADIAEKRNIKILLAMNSIIKQGETRVNVLTEKDLN